MNKKVLGVVLFSLVIITGGGCSRTTTPVQKVPDAPPPPYNTAPIKAETTPAEEVAPAPSKTAPKTGGVMTPAVKPAAPTAAASLPYSKAVTQYSDARFQFITCHAYPSSLTVKQGSKLMLDNRDSVQHRIKVGAQSYTIDKYGYVIMTAVSAGQQTITCDGGGTGLLNVQP